MQKIFLCSMFHVNEKCAILGCFLEEVKESNTKVLKVKSQF